MCRKEPVMLTVASRKKTISKANTVIIHKILFSQIVYLLTIYHNLILYSKMTLNTRLFAHFQCESKKAS